MKYSTIPLLISTKKKHLNSLHIICRLVEFFYSSPIIAMKIISTTGKVGYRLITMDSKLKTIFQKKKSWKHIRSSVQKRKGAFCKMKHREALFINEMRIVGQLSASNWVNQPTYTTTVTYGDSSINYTENTIVM